MYGGSCIERCAYTYRQGRKESRDEGELEWPAKELQKAARDGPCSMPDGAYPERLSSYFLDFNFTFSFPKTIRSCVVPTIYVLKA
jgi:hypothetical protein